MVTKGWGRRGCTAWLYESLNTLEARVSDSVDLLMFSVSRNSKQEGGRNYKEENIEEEEGIE